MSRPCELPPDVLSRRHWILRVCCLPAATPFIVIPLVRKFPQATLDKGAWSVHAVDRLETEAPPQPAWRDRVTANCPPERNCIKKPGHAFQHRFAMSYPCDSTLPPRAPAGAGITSRTDNNDFLDKTLRTLRLITPSIFVSCTRHWTLGQRFRRQAFNLQPSSNDKTPRKGILPCIPSNLRREHGRHKRLGRLIIGVELPKKFRWEVLMAMSAEPMNAGQVVRDRRIHARLTGLLVSARSGVGRSRLSDIERGYIIPRAEELVRINAAIDSLNEARRAMERTASEVGWPAGAI